MAIVANVYLELTWSIIHANLVLLTQVITEILVSAFQVSILSTEAVIVVAKILTGMELIVPV